jgi:hypothetical protein
VPLLLTPDGMIDGSSDAQSTHHYTVFSQRAPVHDVDAWNAYAVRFLRVRLGLAERPGHGAGGPWLRLVVAPDDGGGSIVSLRGRAREARDLHDAERADTGGGLASLARRCPSVWLVGARGEDPAAVLRLATVLAGVTLGPILDRTTGALFGVKTAREKLG